ncbi:agamous-like MADS-box protein MADS9 isoform X2 [Prosopis cineraria]|uniref:agamous-like MADS-box protein MADS9 isoform X2 n=1 Tax=Prosopis cineraria TaxID=364024 RepID=UPI00240F9F74|nr:agamous-like MADS-box protein MADS9 isoform X2 [Prosopis cineraria]
MVRVCYCICLCISPQIFTINPKQEDHQREGKRKSLPREMGRGKIEIKRIENSSNRQVTYSKRKNGILKKAKEITVLCDAQVSLIIFAASGKMHEYISPSTTLIDILERYHKTSGKRLWDAKHEDLNNEIDRLKKENDSMQIELRHLKGEDVNQLNYKELMALEDALECGLDGVRERQMEIYRAHRRNGKILEEENRELNFILQRLAMEGARELENGFDQSVREFHSLMPFAFRVQPMQPNLHERM